MPLLSAFDVEPLVDGRQSVAAMRIRRGVCRLLRELGATSSGAVTLEQQIERQIERQERQGTPAPAPSRDPDRAQQR